MMMGLVDVNLEPRLPLTVRAASDPPQEIEVVIDTGFNGFFGPLAPAALAKLEVMSGDRLMEFARAVVSGNSLDDLGLS